ncbi:E3 ubiquitin-protein ligase PPP1R11-like [Lineus longissimus]|uniref:E3 ubiquitin-protein ligase PPP1R11-like n=1 Tax=Lineus longissimus TaxID=88925 RepID=UPI002B4F17AB
MLINMAAARAKEPRTTTVSETVTRDGEENPTLVLRLKKPKNDRKVSWTEGTVDNEMMNKKKSKCCCIYEKPKMFGESSDEDDDDCTGNCHGHKKKCYRHDLPNGEGTSGDGSSPGESAQS